MAGISPEKMGYKEVDFGRSEIEEFREKGEIYGWISRIRGVQVDDAALERAQRGSRDWRARSAWQRSGGSSHPRLLERGMADLEEPRLKTKTKETKGT